MTNSYFSLVAKNDKKNFLIPLICGAIPVVGFTYAVIKNPKKELTGINNDIGLIILLSFLIFVFLFFCYKYFFDNKTKLIIDRDGIWTSKYGQTKWQSVCYVYQREIRGRLTEQKLIIKLYEIDKEIKLDTTFLDKTADEIITAIKEHSKKFDIQFLDKEIQ